MYDLFNICLPGIYFEIFFEILIDSDLWRTELRSPSWTIEGSIFSAFYILSDISALPIAEEDRISEVNQ